MIERRGHRKLRLTSRKHFNPKPKRAQNRTASVDETPPADELYVHKKPSSLKISLPISSYMDSPLRSIDELLGRLKKQGSIPSGMERNVVNRDIIDL